MTEYWVSNAKYYCKFCKLYVADNKPVWFPPCASMVGMANTPVQSRQHHDSGLKHKNSVEMFMKNQKEQKLHGAASDNELKRQLAEIDRAARAAVALDRVGGYEGGLQAPPPPPMPVRAPLSYEQHQKQFEQEPTEENSGIYKIRGKTFLDGRVFESKLTSGRTCQVFVEDLDEWLDGLIMKRREIHVPHTSVVLKSFDVSYTTAEGEQVEETGIPSDRLRILAAEEELGDVVAPAAAVPEAAPVINQDTGIGMWQTVTVREVDEEKEAEAFETAKQSMLDEMNNPSKADIAAVPTHGNVNARDPHRDPNAKVYKGFSIEPVAATLTNQIIADGEVVHFRKRKAAVAEDASADGIAASASSDTSNPASAPVVTKAASRPRNIRKRLEE